MKVNDIIMVYEKPLTKESPEGKAIIKHIYSIDKITGLALCDVKFLSDGLLTTRRV